MTPTVSELLLGNFIALMEPPPPEALGDFMAGKVAVTGMIAMLAAQEAERGAEARIWENQAIRDLLTSGGAAIPAGAETEKDYAICGLDRVNATLRKALIALHTQVEEKGDRDLDHAILRFYVKSADMRRLDMPPMPGN
ncbi:hypothetical protein [Caulobacter sp. NIBR1757]|uniref:hypothetical protein n=1 Tax=Caulobacter sp. NIBR1757 TaxID=3016000 RepID=UPI0022F0091A|nr:hypothetical protein [Caulobacter sp. NIBR1757]WGM38931.1 hypothetical protein AMEJIAPC_01841 [Caulobacter sp. NIBR1757]